eukprot:Skav203166  [mRNA]  locus=scaffold371:248364:249752:+ [translate_table: standard]
MTEELKRELLAKGGTLVDWELALTSGIPVSDLQWVDARSAGAEAQETARRIMAKGHLVEYECYDDRGRGQGRAIIRLEDWADYGTTMLRAHHILASDEYYDWYGKNTLKVDQVVYHICGGPRRSCKEKLVRGDRRLVIHLERWRMITPMMMIQGDYTARLGMAALKEWVKDYQVTVPEAAAPPGRLNVAGEAAKAVGSGADAALARVPSAARDDEERERGREKGSKQEPRYVAPKGSVASLLEKRVIEHRAALKKKEEKEKGEKKERGRSRSRRRRRRRKSSGDSKSKSSGSSHEGFRMPSARGEEELWRRSQRHPGKLLKSGMEELQRFLANRSEVSGDEEGQWMQYKMMGYVNQVIFSQHPQASMGIRNYRELVTLGTGIDLLLSGKVAELGDLLMQRIRALEASLNEQTWSTARHLELIPATGASLTSEVDRRRAASRELSIQKLRELTQKSGGGGAVK